MNNQYGNELILGFGSIVDAVYQPIGVTSLDNNVLITALPHQNYTSEEILERYSVPVSIDEKTLSKTSFNTKLYQVSELDKLRVPLPFIKQLESEFIRCLHESYSKRKFVSANNILSNQSGVRVNPCESPPCGFTLLGCSGSGKTSALKLMLNSYPQVINHHNIEGYESFKQVVYLVVTCSTNSNFSALYASIGEALDNALGTSCYEEMIIKARGLGEKLRVIAKLVQEFAIGTIIFDEIQLIKFEGTAENTYDSLLVLSNITGVAISVVGTDDAFHKMFHDIRIARRTGSPIIADAYCSNLDYFKFIMTELYKYQWQYPKQELTPEIINAYHKATGGIVFMAIKLYMRVTIDCIITPKTPKKITPTLINKIANKYFSQLLLLIHDRSGVAELSEEIKKIADKYNEDISILSQKNDTKDLLEVAKYRDESIIIDQVEALIKSMFDSFDSNLIRDTTTKIMNTENISDTNKLAGMVYQEISKKRKKSMNKNKSNIEFINV